MLGNKLWVVEKILSFKKEGKKKLYLVKWLGWDDTENTWETEENLFSVKEMLQEFKKNAQLSDTSDDEDGKSKKHSIKSKRGESSPEIEEIYDPRIARNSKKIRKCAPRIMPKVSKPFILTEDIENYEKAEFEEKIYGTFEVDKVLEIEEHAIYTEEEKVGDLTHQSKVKNLMFKIQWAKRSDGTQPQATWYSASDTKRNCAEELVNYYEKFIKFWN